MKAYQVPRAKSTPHGFKYSLVYIYEGRRIVGYDNHEHQGDHRHKHAMITPYVFTSVDQLTTDFLIDVATAKKEIRQ